MFNRERELQQQQQQQPQNEQLQAQALGHLTRIDDLLARQYELLEQTNKLLKSGLEQRIPMQQFRKMLEGGGQVPYEVKSYDMSSARTDSVINVEGEVLTAQTDGSLDGVEIRFNMLTADAVPMLYFNPVQMQFFRIFLTHTAQSSKTLYLAVGRSVGAVETILEAM